MMNMGYKIVDFNEKADVYIINTCTVTNMADKKSRQILRRVKEINPKSILVACGCYAQVAKKELEKIPEIDLILGINEKNEIEKYIENAMNSKQNITQVSEVANQKEFLDFGAVTYTEKTRAVIKVQDGCNQFCSYCIIPYARGRIRSRKPQSVLDEIQKISMQGIKEVVITGIHVASYGKDFLQDNNPTEEANTSYYLIDLLEDIQKIDRIKRIRLGSLEPSLITKEFTTRLSKLSKICNQFHLSLQSGCNSTLKRMNRKYTIEDFENGVNLLRQAFPNVHITTDIIVGFPGETEEDFEDTLDVVRKVQFEQAYMFIYSRRVGTPGDKMENQIPEEIKHKRFNRLKKLFEEQLEENNKKYIGTIQKVLVEGKSKNNENMLTGRTDSNKVVIFEGTEDIINKVVELKIISEHMWYLKGIREE